MLKSLMLHNMTIKLKLKILVVLTIAGFSLCGYWSLDSQKKVLENEMQSKTKDLLLMAKNNGDMLIADVKAGIITTEQAKNEFIKDLKNFNNGYSYFFAYDSKGIQLANGKNTGSLGKNMYQLRDSRGKYIIQELLDVAKSGTLEPVYYAWPKTQGGEDYEKISYAAYIPQLDIMFGIGDYLDSIDNIYKAEAKVIISKLAILVFIIAGIIIVFSRSIVKPLLQSVDVINNMRKGDFSDDIDIIREDCVGLVNKGLHDFKLSLVSNKQQEEEQRKKDLEQLKTAQFVSSATKDVSTAIFQIDDHISGISSSAAELSSTLEDIARKVDDTSQMTLLAESEAEKGTQTIQSLNKISENIGNVVKLIQSIAEKTNLLALNASIEAARAGDEGRGFAVVAEEVKKLAQQTRESTNSISDQVSKIQSSSKDSVSAISNISKQITAINSFTSELVLSINEQKIATNDISNRMENASSSSKFVADKVKEIIDKS